MSDMLFLLKGQVNILNIILVCFIAGWIFRRKGKTKTGKIFFVTGLVVFLLSSTAYLPSFLARKLEEKYLPFDSAAAKRITGKVYVHVLGSGYYPGNILPANQQLGTTAVNRLTEAVRVFRLIDSPVLVCSGNGWERGLKSQAAVAKDAAILEGVPPADIVLLENASTTREEAEELHKKFGRDIQVVVVTDAIHTPRAMRFFKAAGFSNLHAAPCSFEVVEKGKVPIGWWPALSNLNRMDKVMHEYFADVKNVFK